MTTYSTRRWRAKGFLFVAVGQSMASAHAQPANVSDQVSAVTASVGPDNYDVAGAGRLVYDPSEAAFKPFTSELSKLSDWAFVAGHERPSWALVDLSLNAEGDIVQCQPKADAPTAIVALCGKIPSHAHFNFDQWLDFKVRHGKLRVAVYADAQGRTTLSTDFMTRGAVTFADLDASAETLIGRGMGEIVAQPGYPTFALRYGMSGRVGVSIGFFRDGRAQSCHPIFSDDGAALANATCAELIRTSKYLFPVDYPKFEGVRYYRTSLVWQMD